MFKAVTYVSLRPRPGPEGEDELQNILATSQIRNKALGITGALFSASGSFAQFIEGPAAAVDELMESISGDSRHREMKIVSVKYNDRRMFPNWTMAYSGDASYIDRHIKRLLAPLTSGVQAEHVVLLENLMEEFSKRRI